MPNVSDLYSSPFLRASDLTKPVRVRISGAVIGSFADQKTGDERRKVVLSFERGRKQLVVNKTMYGALAAVYGDNTDNWIGADVILSPASSPNGQPTISVAVLPVEQHPAAEGESLWPAGA